MIKRNLELKEHVAAVDHPELTEHLLKEKEDLLIMSLMSTLRHLEYHNKHLQCESVYVAEAQGLFDAVVEMHPPTKSRLGRYAAIVSEPYVETMVVKVQSMKKESLSTAEMIAIRHLLKTSCAGSGVRFYFDLVGDRQLVLQKACAKTHAYYADVFQSKYID